MTCSLHEYVLNSRVALGEAGMLSVCKPRSAVLVVNGTR